jgi:hypothetical protein
LSWAPAGRIPDKIWSRIASATEETASPIAGLVAKTVVESDIKSTLFEAFLCFEKSATASTLTRRLTDGYFLDLILYIL